MDITNQMVIDSINLKFMMKKARVSMLAEDFGPQCFCRHCGARLIERYEDQNNEIFWFHAPIGADECKVGDPEVEVRIYEPNDMVRGAPRHEAMDMEDLKDVYRKLHGKDAMWLKANSKLLKRIYEENADDAGADAEKECNPYLEEVNDDEGNTLTEETDGTDAPTVTDHTEESLARLRFWRKVTFWMVRSPDRVLYDMVMEKFNDEDNVDIMYEEEFEWLMHVTGAFARNPGKMRFAVSTMISNHNKASFIPGNEIPRTYKKGGEKYNGIIHAYDGWYGKDREMFERKEKLEHLENYLKVEHYTFPSRKWPGENMLGIKIINKKGENILEYYKRDKKEYQWIQSKAHRALNEDTKHKLLNWATGQK